MFICCSYDPEQFAGSHIPMLVIGTKLDLAEAVRDSNLNRPSSIAEDCGADEINLVSLEKTDSYLVFLLYLDFIL